MYGMLLESVQHFVQVSKIFGIFFLALFVRIVVVVERSLNTGGYKDKDIKVL